MATAAQFNRSLPGMHYNSHEPFVHPTLSSQDSPTRKELNTTQSYDQYTSTQSALSPTRTTPFALAASSSFSSSLSSPLSSSLPESASHFPHPPQSLGDTSDLKALPDAPHRQAWASHPTFRWFRRTDYQYDVREVKGPNFNLDSRGDNYYKPLSLEEQSKVNQKVMKRIAAKGLPRLGEW